MIQPFPLPDVSPAEMAWRNELLGRDRDIRFTLGDKPVQLAFCDGQLGSPLFARVKIGDASCLVRCTASATSGAVDAGSTGAIDGGASAAVGGGAGDAAVADG